MKNLAFTLILCLFSIYSFSQDSTKSASFSVSTNFSAVPVSHITGTDTGYQNALSIAPALKFRSKSGWGITYSPAFVFSGSNPGIYMHTITAGYERYGRNIDLTLDYSHFFFSKNFDVPYTPINNELYFSLDYTKAWLQPIISGSIGFGRNTETASSAYEIALVGGISHDFSFDDKSVFSYIELTPSLLLNAGTNEYFSFLSTSKYISHTSKFDSYVKGTKGKSSAGPSLGVRNLELNLETSFEIGSFSVQPAGGLYLPTSGTDKTLNGYWEVILRYRLK